MVLAPLGEVIKYAATLQAWQQHLVQGLLQDGHVSSDRQDETFALLLADHGLLDEDPPAGQRVAVAVDARDKPTQEVVLLAVGPLTDVNLLAPGQTLPFATDGLTVVYGENASGKSGYVRVLKSICGAPAARPRILPNVLSETVAVQPAAEVRYRSASGDATAVWRVGDEPIPALEGVQVFDSDSAPLLSEGERVLEFLPRGLEVLGKLADAMVVLGSRIDRELAAVRTALPAIDVALPSTRAGRILMRLNERQALPTEVEIKEAASWSGEDSLALADREASLAVDPIAAATRSERLATALANMAQRTRELEQGLGDEAIEAITAMRKRAPQARSAAAAIAENLSRDVSLLSDVGSDPWRQMFAYAQQYAALAWGSSALPPEIEDARCPLCQQRLDDEAAARLHLFSEYVQGEAEARAVQAENELADRLTEVANFKIPTREDAQAVLAVVEPVRPAAADDIDAAGGVFELAEERRQSVLAGATPAPGEWTPDIPQRLEGHAEGLRALATQQRRLEDASARAALQREVDELRARHALSVNLAPALKRLELLQRIRNLAVARQVCDTSAVSRKNSELRSAFLTADYEARLRREFGQLGLGHLPLKLSARTQAGHSYVSIVLDTPVSARNKEILSDGEMRALALACFFADAGRLVGVPPIILDDPVSSLDHQRVERVAQRLVAEARKGRQVIVFTHSLVFFHELWVRASAARVATSTHWIRTVLSVPGHVRASERPWEVQDVKPRLNDLEQRLAATKRIADTSTNEYRSAVSHFYTGLRETWERLIEEQLLGSVVERFRLGVETLRLSVVEVTSDDYAKVYFAMKRASEFSGHDRPVARELAPPTPDELARDLTEIRDYTKDLKVRHAKVDKERRARHAPPQGTLDLGA